MTPTRTRTLLLVAVAFAVATWLVTRLIYNSLPPLPWTMVPALVIADRPRAPRANPWPSRDQAAVAAIRRADGGAGESLLADRGRDRGSRGRIRGGGGRLATGCRATPGRHRRRYHAGHVGAPRPRGVVPGALLPCAGRSGSRPARPAAKARGSLSLRAARTGWRGHPRRLGHSAGPALHRGGYARTGCWGSVRGIGPSGTHRGLERDEF